MRADFLKLCLVFVRPRPWSDRSVEEQTSSWLKLVPVLQLVRRAGKVELLSKHALELIAGSSRIHVFPKDPVSALTTHLAPDDPFSKTEQMKRIRRYLGEDDPGAAVATFDAQAALNSAVPVRMAHGRTSSLARRQSGARSPPHDLCHTDAPPSSSDAEVASSLTHLTRLVVHRNHYYLLYGTRNSRWHARSGARDFALDAVSSSFARMFSIADKSPDGQDEVTGRAYSSLGMSIEDAPAAWRSSGW